MLAAGSGCEDVVRILLDVPAIDIYVTNRSGGNALSVAEKKGHQGIVQMLRDFEAKYADR